MVMARSRRGRMRHVTLRSVVAIGLLLALASVAAAEPPKPAEPGPAA